MPKKSATARGGTQRNKSKAQKSFELVRPVPQESPANRANTANAVNSVDTSTPEVVRTSTPTVPKTRTVSALPTVPEAQKERGIPEAATAPATSTEVTPKGSAAARLAARRQATQKAQQRSAPALITPEHYSYVRKDLIFIAVLASIMFLIIIVLHFVPGIGI